jgi:hypothetical protein
MEAVTRACSGGGIDSLFSRECGYYSREFSDSTLSDNSMELFSSFGDSNRPLVNVCIPTYVGIQTWGHT